jgi:hypothetical protein
VPAVALAKAGQRAGSADSAGKESGKADKRATKIHRSVGGVDPLTALIRYSGLWLAALAALTR